MEFTIALEELQLPKALENVGEKLPGEGIRHSSIN